MDTARCKRGRDRALTLAAVRSLVVMGSLALASAAAAETWRGLEVAPEHRCSAYDKKADYPYPQSVEDDIVRQLGAVYGPYTGTCFTSKRQTDIEHIVAASEAHDSGLCAADRATRTRFAQDLRNLTLASPEGEPPPEVRQGRRGMAPGPEPVLVRRPRARCQARLRAHRRPARGCHPRSDPLPVHQHRDRTARVPDRPSVKRGCHAGSDRRRRRARALRRQPQWPDHLQGKRAGMGSRPSLARIPLTGTCETATGTAWSASKQAKPKKRLPRRPAPGLPSSPPSRGPRCKPIAALRPATRGARKS